MNNVRINGDYLVNDKNVTGFTNTGDEAVQLTNVFPFPIEDTIKKNGGLYTKLGDWEIYAVLYGRLITGQNPASSVKVAKELLKIF